MADNVHPAGPSQPTLNQAYTTPGNPAETEPAEQAQQQANASTNTAKVDQRIPSEQSTSQSDATPSSLGYGVHGAPPSNANPEDHDRSNELTADQMGAPGEGKVASAVKGEKPGAGPGQPGLESDLDRKKAEQAPARAEMEERKQDSVDVGGVLGQRSAPADPTT